MHVATNLRYDLWNSLCNRGIFVVNSAVGCPGSYDGALSLPDNCTDPAILCGLRILILFCAHLRLRLPPTFDKETTVDDAISKSRK